ncbi:MAG: alpha/beta hydrolase [Bacteroidota bacterium]
MMTTELQQWKKGGKYLEIGPFNIKVFVRDLTKEGASPEKTLLLLHGFPESSYSYHKILPGISAFFERVVVFDMPGYGLSDKPTEHYTYSLIEQADTALQLWQELGIEGGHLLSHDMGDSVATELVARHVAGLLPAWFSKGFQSFTFTNGSMVLELAKLRVTQKILLGRYGHLMSKLSTFRIFNQQVKSAHGNDKLSDKDIELLWDNVIQQEGNLKNHLMIKYLNDRKRFEKTRWLPALKEVKLPVHVCWGESDAVARVEMAHYLKENICKDAVLSLMPGVGHFCQLGSPEIWVKNVSAFYRDTFGLG